MQLTQSTVDSAQKRERFLAAAIGEVVEIDGPGSSASESMIQNELTLVQNALGTVKAHVLILVVGARSCGVFYV